MAIKYVILDFDGTCTRIEDIWKKFFEGYRQQLAPAFAKVGLELTPEVWSAALDRVKKESPHAAWTLGGGSSAPAYADPYIASGEAANLLARPYRPNKDFKLPGDAYANTYDAARADWRSETADVLKKLIALDLRVGFISNSATDKIQARLVDLLGSESTVRKQISVTGNASKFVIQEPSFALEDGFARKYRARFHRVPATATLSGEATLRRPAYLRRGLYFEALCAFWDSVQAGENAAQETLVCGDVWELDLALPAALGCHVHLISRAAPFDTCDYERAQVDGNVSDDLNGLIERVRRLKSV